MKKILYIAGLAVLTACGSGKFDKPVLEAPQPPVEKTSPSVEKTSEILDKIDLGSYGYAYVIKVIDHTGRNHTVVAVRNSGAQSGVAVCELMTDSVKTADE